MTYTGFSFIPRVEIESKDLNPSVIVLESQIAEAIANVNVTPQYLIEQGIYESFVVSEEIQGETSIALTKNGVTLTLRFCGLGRNDSGGLINTYARSGGNLTDVRHLIISLRQDDTHVTLVTASDYAKGAGVDIIGAFRPGENSYELRGEERSKFEMDTFNELLSQLSGLQAN